jgi:signal transduction histidine kinase
MEVIQFMRTWMRRFSFRGLSIQQRLPLLICVLLLSLIVVFSLVSYVGVKKAALSTGKERLLTLTGQLSTMLSQSTQTLISGTRAAAARPPVRDFLLTGDTESQIEALDALLKLRQDRDSTSLVVDLLDKNRKRVLRSSKNHIEAKVNFDSLLTLFPAGDSAAFVGKFFRVRDSMYYPVMVPVTGDNNEVLGYMIRWRLISTTPQAIERLSQLMGAKVVFYIGNNDGSLWTDMIRPVPNPIPADTVRSHNVLEYRKKGDKLIATSKLIPGSSWQVLVEFSQTVVLEPARRFLQWTLILGSVLVVIGIFAAWLMSRNITRPLKKLTAAASSLANGDHSAEVYVDRTDEIGKLARAFNAMVSEVNKAKSGLEQKVIEMEKINEQFRELSAHLQNIREEERKHIAREMHDELGQLLTGFKMDVSWLGKKLERNNDHIVREKLNGMTDIVDDAVKFVRKIAAELRPSILDDLGLVPALEWHSMEFEKRYNIAVEFQSQVAEPDIPLPVATGLFRMYQESLTNVARHSGARKVVTVLQTRGDNICLSITDDGKGFDTSRNEKKTLGLLGMKERAVMIGGKLEIRSEPGRGTTVMITIPVAVIAG